LNPWRLNRLKSRSLADNSVHNKIANHAIVSFNQKQWTLVHVVDDNVMRLRNFFPITLNTETQGSKDVKNLSIRRLFQIPTISSEKFDESPDQIERHQNYLNYRHRQDQDQDFWYIHIKTLKVQKRVDESNKNFCLYNWFSTVFTCQWPKKTSFLLKSFRTWFAILSSTRFKGFIPYFWKFSAAHDPKFPAFCWNV